MIRQSVANRFFLLNLIMINLKIHLSIFENASINISFRYSHLIKTMLLTAFYAYELPIGVLFCLGNIFLTYWIEKVTF